jgi:integrase
MQIAEIFQKYKAKQLRGGSANTARLYGNTLASFARFLRREPMLSDLTDETVESFLYNTVANGLSPYTANKHRSQINALWTFAHKTKLIDTYPLNKALREPERIPVAWLPSEVEQLLQACANLSGRVGDVPSRIWWTSLVHILFDTGERIGAIIQLRRNALNDRWLSVPAELRKGKTRDRLFPLQPETVEAVRTLLRSHGDKTLWPWPYGKTYLWNRYGKILEAAGLPSGRKNKFHKCRKTLCSAVARAGGDPTAAMDHSSPKTTKKYLDPRIVGGEDPSELLRRYLADPSFRKASHPEYRVG